MDTNQHIEHIETVVVGAGQAGLATAYELRRHGREVVVLDGVSRVGDGWRRQWDTLRLYSPAWADALPGLPFPAPRWSFPTKDEFADYLELYAERLALPVRLSTRVERVGALPGGGYAVATDRGQILADNVVVATGTFGRTPQVPSFADQLDPSIVQLHSSEYRNADQLPEGPVLVVGSSHSGCDIAYEVAASHPTVMAGRDTGQIPVSFSSPLLRVVLPTMLFAMTHVATRRSPIGRRKITQVRLHGGGPRLRIQRAELAERGVDWVTEHVTGVEDGLPVVGARGPVEVRTVIWCTGFRQDFRWVDLDVFDEHGWPHEIGGVVESAPGLYFAGLAFQSSAGSMLVLGAGHDARAVAGHIRRHTRAAGRSRQASAA